MRFAKSVQGAGIYNAQLARKIKIALLVELDRDTFVFSGMADSAIFLSGFYFKKGDFFQ